MTVEKLTPRPEQEEVIQRALAEPTHGILDASEVGAGKTLIASEFLVRLGAERVLIVGIKDTYAQWADRLEAQSDGRIKVRRLDSMKAGKQAFADMLAGEPGFYFTGSQYLNAQDWERVFVTDENNKRELRIDKKSGEPVLKDMHPAPTDKGVPWALDYSKRVIGPAAVPKFVTKRNHKFIYKKMRPMDVVVYDEVHMVSNRKSNGIGTVRSIPTDWRYGMSGTFYGNKFAGAHPIARWVWPDVKDEHGEYLIDPSFVRWRNQWCATETPTRRGGLPVTDARNNPVQLVTGEKVPGEFVKTLPCYFRLEAKMLPPKPEVMYVDLLPEQVVDYEQMEEEGVMWLQAHPGLEPLVANLPISKRTRMRTAALGTMAIDADGEVYFHEDTKSSKLSALRQILERPKWVGRQVGIYTHSKRFAKVVVARMRAAGYSAVEWSGDVSSKERDRIKAAFLAGEIRYIVAVIESFGTGLDGFQRVCNRVVWVSESDSTKDNHQALGRFFRPGGDLDDFEHVKIVARDTIDEDVLGRNSARTIQNRQTLAAA